ncbi:MAG: Hsp20/alpha crystallin family protein [Ideonella sp. WA131b]|jgi:HSP20 family protein|nr:Hsp20/alpha crystallin family protein [Ideonella sp. WA131b]
MFIVPSSRDTRHLSRLFDDAFDRFFGQVAMPAPEGMASRSPALDVAESDRGYTVKLEMPGVAREDVKVSIDGRQVTVQAQNPQQEARKDGERVVYRERSVPSYARTFALPVEIDQAEAGAKLEHGVLTLYCPKRGARHGAEITVS